MRFEWKGFNAMGKVIDGELDAASMEDAAGRLREQKIFVSKLTPMPEAPKPAAPAKPPDEPKLVPSASPPMTPENAPPAPPPGTSGQNLTGWAPSPGLPSGWSAHSGYSGFHYCECAAPGYSMAFGGAPECVYCHHLIKPDWKSTLSDQLKTISEICDTATDAGIPAEVVGPIAKEMIRQLLMDTWSKKR